jgi:hypothetical protein
MEIGVPRQDPSCVSTACIWLLATEERVFEDEAYQHAKSDSSLHCEHLLASGVDGLCHAIAIGRRTGRNAQQQPPGGDHPVDGYPIAPRERGRDG